MTTRLTSDLVEQLETIANALPDSLANDETHRKRALQAAHAIAMKAEQPAELAHRIAWSPLIAVVAHIACNLHIFQVMDTRPKGITLHELVSMTKADQNLLQRIMRYLTSHEMATEVGKNIYAANKITHTLAMIGNVGQLSSTVPVSISAWGALPSFLHQTEYRNPSNPIHCSFQMGHSTEDTFFGWLTKRPELLSKFNDFMALPRPQWKSCLAQFFPSERIFEGAEADEVLFVDIGGGIGHQCRDLRSTYPKEEGRIVLQDLPEVLHGLSLEDIDIMPHDMMQPQPIVGARAYYLRTVCHDHPDHVCSVFLSHIVAAMREKSVLLIDDLVVPAVGASDYTTAIDIGMMALFASMERSEQQWKDLLEQLGLKIVGLHEYGPQDRYIVEAVLAKSVL